MKKMFITGTLFSILISSCASISNTNGSKDKDGKISSEEHPKTIKIEGVAQNPEGIEFNKLDETFLLSSLNAGPILKVSLDGTFKPFTSGDPYPLSTAGLQIDYENNRLLATGFNGLELMDEDPNTKGISNLRIYDLKTGVLEKDINLSSLVPDAPAYMANDIAIDKNGNIYVTDWYAGVVYKIDKEGKSSVFWQNNTGLQSGANGIDYHPDGYLLVSLVSVNEKGLYANYGLVKVPIDSPESSEVVKIGDGFTGFDGMVLKKNGNVVGVTNNGSTPGGNALIELYSDDNWKSAKIVNTKTITSSTTVAITPKNENYIINQDFSPESGAKQNWTIEKIQF